MKKVLKRTLAIMLSVVMLVSCWVFVAPKSDAANTGGTYYFEFSWTNNGSNFSNSYKTNRQTQDDSCGVTISYKENNGTGTTVGFWNKDIRSVDGLNNKSTTKTVSGSCAGFPYALMLSMDDNRAAVFGGTAKVEVTSFKIGKSASSLTQVWGGKIHVESVYNPYAGEVRAGNTTTNDNNPLSNGDDPTVSTNSAYTSSWKYPYLNSGGAISSGNINLNGTGNVSTSLSTASGTDQYGVAYSPDNCTFSKNASLSYNNDKVTISGTTITATKDAHISTNGVNSQTLTVKGTWAGSTTVTKTTTCTITDETYIVTWKNYASAPNATTGTLVTDTTTSVYYGDTPSGSAIPSSTNAYYTKTKHYTGGSYSPSQVTGETSFTMGNYTEADHGSWKYSEISGNNLQHLATCGSGGADGKGCGHTEAVSHSYGATTLTFASNGQTATATHTCGTTGCGHVQTAAATVTSTVAIAANCTTEGTTTYTATSPYGDDTTATKDVQDIAINSNNHDFTDDVVKKAALRTEATCTADATYWYSCSRCATVSAEGDASTHYFTDEGSALGHDCPAFTTVLAPTCTEEGSESTTCSRCGTEFSNTLPALGHDRYEIYNAPTNGSAGSVCYACNNCTKYWTATYDTSTQTYSPNTATEYNTLALAKRNTPASAKVSPPKFNDFYNETIDYNYAMRGASLKIAEPFDFSDRNTRQGLRFTASLHVPDGVTYTEDNNIVDFGFIYSQTNFVNNNINNLTLETVRSDRKIAKMSVADNNSDKGPFNGSNWTGVTAHADEILGGTTLTFNLLVNVKAYNWTQDYCARAYVVYNYNGHQYTVYDNQFSSRSVEYIARAAVDNPDETLKVRNFCQDKVLTPIDEGWITPNS